MKSVGDLVERLGIYLHHTMGRRAILLIIQARTLGESSTRSQTPKGVEEFAIYQDVRKYQQPLIDKSSRQQDR
jgi:hypothetical protein